MGRRKLSLSTYDEVIAELDRLQAAGYRQLGQWNLGQACGHLSHYLRGSLDGFDFINITTAVNAVDGGQILNEKSVEIDAVADVAADPFGDYDGDGDIDLSDIGGVQLCFDASGMADPQCMRLDRQPDGLVDVTDAAAFVERITGPR